MTALTLVSLVYVKMRYLILILLCSVQFTVQFSDWLNRTVRVDLITNRTDFDPKYELFERSNRMTGAVDATNGQYPWSVMTTAWSFQGGFGVGTTCCGTIISINFVLSNLGCVRRDSVPAVSTIEVSIGNVRWNSTRSPTNYVNHYYFITPSPENRPNIVLFRLLESLAFNPNIQPVRLPSLGNFSYEGWSSYILGFQTPRIGLFSAQLGSVNARILNNELCNFNGNAPDYEICGSGGDPNEGGLRPIIRVDAFSGGAWIVHEYTSSFEYNPVIIGIHQYQFANQTASFGYATRVSRFLEWIQTFSVE